MKKTIITQFFLVAFVLLIGATMLFGCAKPGTSRKFSVNDSLGIEVFSYVLENGQTIYVSKFKQKADTIDAPKIPEVNTITWDESDGEDIHTRVSVIIQDKDSVVVFRK